jgi:DNA-binding CsgD family transcriptional regulator
VILATDKLHEGELVVELEGGTRLTLLAPALAAPVKDALALAALGRDIAQIAAELHLSVKGVCYRLAQARKAFGARTTHEAVARAYRSGALDS